jgi:hypothetical protein
MVCTAHFVQWFIDGVAAREKEIRSKLYSLLASKFQEVSISLGPKVIEISEVFECFLNVCILGLF